MESERKRSSNERKTNFPRRFRAEEHFHFQEIRSNETELDANEEMTLGSDDEKTTEKSRN